MKYLVLWGLLALTGPVLAETGGKAPDPIPPLAVAVDAQTCEAQAGRVVCVLAGFSVAGALSVVSLYLPNIILATAMENNLCPGEFLPVEEHGYDPKYPGQHGCPAPARIQPVPS